VSPQRPPQRSLESVAEHAGEEEYQSQRISRFSVARQF
jgi:hypothetical protein